jgi:hypothetical protein
MALGDPNDPTTIDPVVAQALGWTPPPEFFQPWNALPEYLPGSGTQTLPPPSLPPPTPPPKDKKIGAGPGGGVEETAAPVPAAADTSIDPNLIELEDSGSAAPSTPTINLGYPHPPVAPPMPTPTVPMQPGLGIPAHTLDALPPLPEAASSAMLPPSQDPWANTLPDGSVAAPDHISGAPPTDYLNTNELGDQYDELQRRDPVGYAKLREAKLVERDTAIANQRAKALQADTDWMHRSMAAREAAKAKADARAAQVDQEAKNLSADGGFWESRSGGQVAAAYLSAIIGGIMSVRTGRPNDALAGINAAIERHVAAQKTKLADGRSAVSQMYQRLGDNYAADETMRIASWREVEQQLLTEQQNYDPRGVGAMRIADAAAAARAQQAAALLRYQTATQKQLEDAAKAQLERERLEETKRHAKQEEAIAWTGRANDAKRIKLDEKQGDRAYDLDLKKIDAKAAADLETADKEGAIGNMSADGHVAPLKNADGSTWHTSKEEQPKLIAQRNAVQNLYIGGAQLKELRDKAGGANRKLSPTDQAEYDRIVNSMTINYANAKGISLADEQSQKFSRDAFLGADPSEYNLGGVKERIDRSLQEAASAYHNNLIGHNYSGPLPQFFEPKPHVDTNDEIDAKERIKLDQASRDKLLPKNIREDAQQRLDSLITQPEEPIDRGTHITVKDTGD